MLSRLAVRWCIAVHPLRAVIELSWISILETADHSSWHGLCHVDGDGIDNPGIADANPHRRGRSSSPFIA